MKIFLFVTLMMMSVIGILHAATSFVDSGVITVDTRINIIDISGRVFNKHTKLSMPGVQVNISGQTVTTSSDGEFSFVNVALEGGDVLTFIATGFVSNQVSVSPPVDVSFYVMPDVYMRTNMVMSVESIEAKLEGIFLQGAITENEYTAKVDWSGKLPARIDFSNPQGKIQSVSCSGNEATIRLVVGQFFQPSMTPGANYLEAVAVARDNSRSIPYRIPISLIPLPLALDRVVGLWPFNGYGTFQIGVDYELPNPAIHKHVNLPVLGKFGVDIAVNGSFDYTIDDGSWEMSLGVGAEGKQGKRGKRPKFPGITRSPKLKLYIGSKEISGKVSAGARGEANMTKGITFDEVFGHGEIEVKLELTRYGLLDLLGPGLSSTLSQVPKLDELTKGTSIIIWAIPGIEGDITWAVNPEFKFKSLEFTGKIGLEASYEPNVGFGKARFYLGGEPSVTLQVPGDLFKEFKFRVYAGFECEIWIFNVGPAEYVFLDYTYPSFIASPGNPEVVRRAVRGTEQARLSLIKRSYLEAGPESFVLGQAEFAVSGNSITEKLQAFREMGEPDKKSMVSGSVARQKKMVELPLVSNVFPSASPSLAGRNSELMMVYVADNGSTNGMQFTDIKWTRWDGVNWSVPQTIENNTQAEFNPQVTYDGNGDAIAVWERVASTNFNEMDINAMAAQMEIVWSRWDHLTGLWSVPAALTFNNYLDHLPLLCGPMADGGVMLVWTKNTANQLMGTNAPGQDTVLWNKWSSSSKTWGTAQTVADNIVFRTSQSFAGVSNYVVYAWTQDMDGSLTNDNDQELFYMACTNGVWNSMSRFSSGFVPNKNVKLAVSAASGTFMVWQNSSNLVMSRNLSTNLIIVRPDSATAGFSDYALTVGPAGNLAIIWQEMSTFGSDARYRIYDPASSTWSKDVLMFNDIPLERSFSPVWDNVGNLTVAYNKVDIVRTNKTVTLESGETLTITNVPQPGRVDLCVTKKLLVKDIGFDPGDFTVDGGNYLPGDAVMLSAMVRNLGDVALSNAVVSFYDGNPTNGGALISNITVSSWLDGASSVLVSNLWIVPEPATNHTLYAIVDYTNAITEFNETNNMLSVKVGGVDLMVNVTSHRASTNGSVRVVATVRNLCAPKATNSVLAIRREGIGGTPLVTSMVPSLDPGRAAQVELELPPGTQPEGESVYRLFADETKVTGDVETNNNSTAFSINLWIDSDGDGIADGWMTQYFGHATGRTNDLSMAQDDADGDGMSNYSEFCAGTSPKDRNSYLKVTSAVADGTNGFNLVWGSASNKLYTIQRAESLTNTPVFTNLVEHVLSTPPQNSWIDVSAVTNKNYYYRIKVE